MNYKRTTAACYIGHIFHAVMLNITPVFFIPLREMYGFSFSALGLLVLVNFSVQIFCDVFFSSMVDKYGFKRFAVLSHSLGILGLFLFAFLPYVLPKGMIYGGIMLGTVIFSFGGGLLEVLLSPIVNAIPSDAKASGMSILHSFYAWGQAFCVLATTIALAVFGRDTWQIITFVWLIVPCFNLILFITAPMPSPVDESVRLGMSDLIFKPIFIFSFLAIVFGAASEITMASWTSSFLEVSVGLPKEIGDIFGLAAFGMMLGAGRLLHGIFGHKKIGGKEVSMNSLLIVTSALAVGCYIVAALSPIPLLAVAACGLTGLGVSMMWPGVLSFVAERYPTAGSWIFAILACGGDIGCSMGPALAGILSDNVEKSSYFGGIAQNFAMTGEQFGLKTAMLLATLFPLLTLICHLILKKISKKLI